MSKTEPIDVYRMALEAVEASGNTKRSSTAAAATRDLEILFYGMFCFHPDGNGYRVLVPNGLQASPGIPVHAAAVSVRDRSELATARWSSLALKNDFVFGDTVKTLTVEGLVSSALDDTLFNDGYVTVLNEIDPNFDVRKDPDVIYEMRVDIGTLTVHEVGSQGMLIVRWAVQAPVGQPVRFDFGTQFIDVPPTADQVTLVNAGNSTESGSTDKHFLLYRKLSTEPTKDLKHTKARKKAQTTGGEPKDPTFGYIKMMTPDFVCSGVQSKVR